MRKNESGSVALIITLAVSGFLSLGLLIFGVWAFSGKQDIKNNLDQKIAAAVEVEKQKISSQKDNEFLQKEKEPTKTYTAPESYGSLSVAYPKTWSGLVEENASDNPINGYWYPNVLPAFSANKPYALRVQIINSPYATYIKSFDDLIKQGKLQSHAFHPEKISAASALGVRLDGNIDIATKGAIILLPLRDKTIRIMTQSEQFLADFNKYVAPSITYNP